MNKGLKFSELENYNQEVDGTEDVFVMVFKKDVFNKKMSLVGLMPNIEIIDGYWYINGVNTNEKAYSTHRVDYSDDIEGDFNGVPNSHYKPSRPFNLDGYFAVYIDGIRQSQGLRDDFYIDRNNNSIVIARGLYTKNKVIFEYEEI